MSRILSAVCLALALAALSGCGVSSKYMTKLAAPEPVQVDPSLATVVFIRPSGYGGSKKSVIVDNGGRFLGESWGWTYFAVKVPPGEHTFVAWSEGTPALKATLEPGKVYYVEIGATIGAWSLRTRLFANGPEREQWAQLPMWLGKSKMLVPNEAAGQAYLMDKRDTVADVLAKGQANYNGYEGEEKSKRTIVPSDGVPAPVPAR